MQDTISTTACSRRHPCLGPFCSKNKPCRGRTSRRCAVDSPYQPWDLSDNGAHDIRLQEVQCAINYTFRDAHTLANALTLRAAGSDAVKDNCEHYGFIGDRVADTIAAVYVFAAERGNGDIGEMTGRAMALDTKEQQCQMLRNLGFSLFSHTLLTRTACGQAIESASYQAVLGVCFFKSILGAVFVDSGNNFAEVSAMWHRARAPVSNALSESCVYGDDGAAAAVSAAEATPLGHTKKSSAKNDVQEYFAGRLHMPFIEWDEQRDPKSPDHAPRFRGMILGIAKAEIGDTPARNLSPGVILWRSEMWCESKKACHQQAATEFGRVLTKVSSSHLFGNLPTNPNLWTTSQWLDSLRECSNLPTHGVASELYKADNLMKACREIYQSLFHGH